MLICVLIYYLYIRIGLALWLCFFTFCTLSISWPALSLIFIPHFGFVLRAVQSFLFWKVLSRQQSQDTLLFSVSVLIEALDVKYPSLIWQFYGSCMRSPWILSKTSLSGDISKLILLFCVAWLLSYAFKLHTLPLRNTTIRILSRPFLLMSCYWWGFLTLISPTGIACLFSWKVLLCQFCFKKDIFFTPNSKANAENN